MNADEKSNVGAGFERGTTGRLSGQFNPPAGGYSGRHRDRPLHLSQIIPGHFIGFWQVEEGEQGGGNVAECAASAEFSPVGGVNEYEGYGVGGVCGVGFAGVVVDHLFGVAVVGGDDGCAVCFFYGFEDVV